MMELVFTRNGRPLMRQRLDNAPLNIGRDTDNHIQLTDEEISRHHLSIKWQDGQYILTDISRNGTLVNNKLVESSPINIGDTISLGSWTLEVAQAETGATPPTIVSTHQTTSVLNFDSDKKTIATERLNLTVTPPDKNTFTADVTQSEAVIGSMDTCDIIVTDPFVSRKHCRIAHRQGQVILLDLESTNGTYVENIRVNQVNIPPQGSFQIGKTHINYKLERDAEIIKPSVQTCLGQILGRSKAMREIFSLIERVAPSDATMLITGESGTGKELVARQIHQMSHRSSKPFISINCGALPASIIESQLFGHERGAFTGAVERSVGLFEQAHGGTLFLDEIGEMPLELQTRLLQVIENRMVRRLGGKQEVEVDFRLIAATNNDLQRLVSEQRFRQDLFYRLYVVPIKLTPLRDREGDVEFLANHFVDELAPRHSNIGLSANAINKLSTHNWPGNVRELKNVIQRTIILSDSQTIEADSLSFAPLSTETMSELNLEVKEKEAIITALKENKGNQTKTAKHLGIARTTLATKISKYEIDLEKL